MLNICYTDWIKTTITTFVDIYVHVDDDDDVNRSIFCSLFSHVFYWNERYVKSIYFFFLFSLFCPALLLIIRFKFVFVLSPTLIWRSKTIRKGQNDSVNFVWTFWMEPVFTSTIWISYGFYNAFNFTSNNNNSNNNITLQMALNAHNMRLSQINRIGYSLFLLLFLHIDRWKNNQPIAWLIFETLNKKLFPNL